MAQVSQLLRPTLGRIVPLLHSQTRLRAARPSSCHTWKTAASYATSTTSSDHQHRQHHPHHHHGHSPEPSAILLKSRQVLDHAFHARVQGGSAAKAVADLYRSLDSAGRSDFFHALSEYDTILDIVSVDKHLHAWNQGFRNHTLLRAELAPRYERLLSQLIQLPDGIQLLVDMRAQLFGYKKGHPRAAEFNALNEALKHYIRSCFTWPLVDLGRITKDSPAELLAKVRKYEAVHPIANDEDLLRRVGGLGPGRIVFGLFSKAMPNEPLAFVEVALVKGIATSIQKVLNDPAPGVDIPPTQADTAIFYSITQAQKGLTGVDLGHMLLKKVLVDLQSTLPNIKTFCTLSPMPTFAKWFDGADRSILEGLGFSAEALESLKTDWYSNPARAEHLRPLLLKAGYHYLTRERKGRHALDPVSEFSFLYAAPGF